MPHLPHRQQHAMTFLKRFHKRNGYSPTFREIADSMGITPAGAVRHVVALKKKGYIETTPKTARSIRILEPPPKE